MLLSVNRKFTCWTDLHNNNEHVKLLSYTLQLLRVMKTYSDVRQELITGGYAPLSSDHWALDSDATLAEWLHSDGTWRWKLTSKFGQFMEDRGYSHSDAIAALRAC